MAAAIAAAAPAACSSGGDELQTVAGQLSPDAERGPLFGEVTSEQALGRLDGRACAEWIAGAEPAPPTFSFVVDASGSMNEPAPGSERSKWAVTRQAVLDAVDELGAEATLGVVFYPGEAGSGRGGLLRRVFGGGGGTGSCLPWSTRPRGRHRATCAPS